MNELTKGSRIIDKFLEAEGLSGTTATLIQFAATLLLGLIFMKILLTITRKMLKRSKLDNSLHKFVINSVKTILAIILITMCLSVLGVSPSTIIAVVGAAGAAIALALRDSLANIAGGVMIIITKPFSQNDFIDVGEVSGKVEQIDLFLTTLKTYDYKTITIPNGIINTSILVNHSLEDKRRVDCVFGIGYDNDIQKVKNILYGICETNQDILKEPEPLIGIAEHGQNAVMVDMKVWCKTGVYWDVKYFLEENVKLAFDEHGINIPYPQLDVHLCK